MMRKWLRDYIVEHTLSDEHDNLDQIAAEKLGLMAFLLAVA
jgi:hypothetical protein